RSESRGSAATRRSPSTGKTLRRRARVRQCLALSLTGPIARQATPPGLIREDLIAAERPASAARGVALGRLFDALPQLPGQRGLEGRRVRRERGSGAPEGHGPFDRRLEVTGRHDIGATFRVYFRTEMPERP